MTVPDNETPEHLGDIPAVPADFQPAPRRPPSETTGAWYDEADSIPDFDLPNADVSAK